MSTGDPAMCAPLRRPLFLTYLLAALVLAGLAAFLVGISSDSPLRAWQAYLVNFLFWMGLSFGAIVFAAVLNITGARWGRSVKRLAEAFSVYLPVGFALFWVLYFGRDHIFPWIREPVVEKQAWLNVPFLFIRDGIGIFLLGLSSVLMVYFSVKGDRESHRSEVRSQKSEVRSQRSEVRSSEHRNLEECSDRDALEYGMRCRRKQKILSPLVAILYAFVLTLLAFDLVMTLDRHWQSSLFGGYFFMGSFYAAVAALYLLSFILTGQTQSSDNRQPQPQLFHDLGKLLLAFCMFTGYLFYAQFLAIWYGNLPEETRYVILRVKLSPWEPVAWAVLFMIFLLPFFVLLSRRIKLIRVPMILLCLMVLSGLWIERFLLVAPSLWRENSMPLGLTEVLVTAGYVGIVGLCLMEFLKRVPAVPLSYPLPRFVSPIDPNPGRENESR